MRRFSAKFGWPLMQQALTQQAFTQRIALGAMDRARTDWQSDSLYLHLRKRAQRSAAAALAASIHNRAIWEPGWFRAQLAGATAMLCAVPSFERADDALGARE